MDELFQQIEKIIGNIDEETFLDEQGCTSEVRKLVADNKSYILKSSFKPKYREWLKSEAETLRTMPHLPIPMYIGFFEEQDGSHLLMSFEEGITLRQALSEAGSSEKELKLIRSFGRFLHHFHEQNKTGTLEQIWLKRQLAKAESYLVKRQTDGSRELLEHLKQSRPKPVIQALIHGDCTTDNVLVRDGEVSLFIDVAGLTTGDPRYDEALAIGRFKDNPGYVKAFYEGYTRYRISEEEYRYFDEGIYEFF
jgi:aminoglycoside phosphotransferase (APT) family kinase protein